MHSAIEDMLQPYNCNSTEDYRNALNEIIQEIALLGLFRGDFFNEAAFYGGTALRIFYGLDRFSEDLDFSLLEPKENFDIGPFCKSVQEELGAYGFEMAVEQKVKKVETAVESAFIKGGTLIHLLKISSITPPVPGVSKNELIKIKLEIDTNPPPGAQYEVKYQLLPIPYHVKLFDLSSLFAGKLHAVLCRNWKNRVKGRDLYDYIWYLSKKIQLNVNHLAHRLKQTGHLSADKDLTQSMVMEMLLERFSSIDYTRAAQDVLPFIQDTRKLDLWSADFFTAITRDYFSE